MRSREAPAARSAPPPEPIAAPLGRAAPEAAPPAPALRFEPAPQPPGAQAEVELLFPFSEQRIRAERAADFVVRMTVSHWPAERVDLSLDDFVPRRRDTLPTPLRLRDLVPEDRELEAGEHLLVATAVHEDGRLVRSAAARSRAPFAAVRFFVGEPRTPARDLAQPFLVYRQPRGTYNGPQAADNVLVDFLVLAESAAATPRTRLSVRGAAAGELLLEQPSAVYVRDLPSGDFQVELSLLDAENEPQARAGARAARTITVNRDAPVPAKQP